MPHPTTRRLASPLSLVMGGLMAFTLTGAHPAAGAADDPYVSAKVPVAKGCIVLGREWAGNKVALVQRRLGTTHELDRYQQDTFGAVKAFQQRKGLAVTGRVNRATWNRMGIDRRFCMDKYTVQPIVESPTSPQERIDTMIRWARGQVGRPYIWGGAGPIGYDCSGLALQAMHAGGRVLPTVTTYWHQRQDFPTATRILESGLPKRQFENRQRGDLIFFGPSGSITHMGIYLGRGRIVEATRPEVRIASLWGRSTPIKQTVIRPFGR